MLSALLKANMNGIRIRKTHCRVRKVNWLVKNQIRHFEMNHNTVMTLSTVYKLNVSVASVIRILNENNTGENNYCRSPKEIRIHH